MNLSEMSVKELQDLIQEAEHLIAAKIEEEKANLLADMRKLATERGFNYDDLVGGKKKDRKKSVAKYQNPQDPSQTWTGKGRQPNWIKNALEAGGDLEQFAI